MSLEPVLRGLFDYAGMFPPAALPFDQALAESARFPTSLRRPSLVANDLVLTPDALGKLDDAALERAGYAGRPCNVCLVGVGLEDAVDQAQAVVAFNEARRDSSVPQRIRTLEIHHDSLEGATETLRDARRAIGDVELYFEPKWDDPRMATHAAEAINMLHGLQSDGQAIGFKARCAGPTAVRAPTLAAILAFVNRHRVPLKLTQGLHHPFVGDVRYENDHGFVNVIVALRLQHALGLPHNDVIACLMDHEPANFTWDQGLGWQGRTALMQRVEDAAHAVPFAIGSCSLQEPDADLAALLDR